MQISSDQSRVHLKIHGRVQGVYFRASALAQAQKLALAGWVRNCPDGSVEMLAEGEHKAIEGLIVWCRRGPDGARVSRVDLDWEQPQNDLVGFSIRR